MITVSESIAVKAPIDNVFDAVSDFARYPKYQPEVKNVKVFKKTNNTSEVAFTVNIITTVSYTLRFKLERPHRITWTMVKGDLLMKANSGAWTLEALGPNLTDLTYAMDVKFGFLVPAGIVNDLIKSHLPAMLKRFKKAAEANAASSRSARKSCITGT